MPFSRKCTEALGKQTHLVRSSVLVVCPIIVHQIDELQLIPRSTFEIIGVVCGSNLDSTSAELHVDGDGVGDDRYPPVNKRMDGKFSMEVFPSGIIRMDSDGGITKHGLWSGSGHHDPVI